MQETTSENNEVLYSHLTDSLTLSDLDGIINDSQVLDPPWVRILEQPEASFRFRYDNEYERRCGCIGSISGMNATLSKRTFPSIQVMNYQGSYVVLISCVTKDGPPYRPHPHYLVENLKKEAYAKLYKKQKRGIYIKIVHSSDMSCSFPNLGILSVKKQDIKTSLELRKELRVDPFGTGFDYSKDIDLNVLRICFQVFLKDADDKYSVQIPAVVSEPIYDKKAISDLTIMKFSHCSAPSTGGTEVILLCDRLPKKGIEIWFYEEYDSEVKWESPAKFERSDIHKQVAISFRTPYYKENLQQPVVVYVELRHESKKGKPRPFQYVPTESDPDGIARKRKKVKERFDLERLFHGDIFSGSQDPREHHLAIGIPRISKRNVSETKPSLAGAFTGVPTMITSNCSGSSLLKSVPINTTSTYPAPLLPYVTMSPNDQGYSSTSHPSKSIVEPTVMHHTMCGVSKTTDMHQIMNISELPSPAMHKSKSCSQSPDLQQMLNISDSVSLPANTAIHQMMPSSESSDMHQMMNISESVPLRPSNNTVIHQMMPCSESTDMHQMRNLSESMPSPANLEHQMMACLESSINKTIPETAIEESLDQETLNLPQILTLFDNDFPLAEDVYQEQSQLISHHF